MKKKLLTHGDGTAPEEPLVGNLSQKSRKPIEQRNVFLPTGFEEIIEEDGGGEGDGSGGTGAPAPAGGEAGTPLPESEYYEIHELIRSKHKGKVEAGRKYHERLQQDNGQTADFNDDTHPLAAMAYFSGIDNQDETPLPGESTDEEIRNELEFRKRLQLQKQLGISNTFTPKPSPY